MPKRVSRQPIFISIESKVQDIHKLTGQYNFHDIRNNAVAFVREGGKLERIGPHPYYLAYYPGDWVFQDSEDFDSGKSSSWMNLDTKGQYSNRV